MGKVRVFLGVHLSFCASGIKLWIPRSPAVLAWQPFQVRSQCPQIHMLFFFPQRWSIKPLTFPTICSNPCAAAMFKTGSQQLLAIQMANTGTSECFAWNSSRYYTWTTYSPTETHIFSQTENGWIVDSGHWACNLKHYKTVYTLGTKCLDVWGVKSDHWTNNNQ